MNGIRPARAEDAPAVARVHVASWQTAYDGLLPASYLQQLDVEARAVRWRSLLTAPDRQWSTLVAEADDLVVGFVTVGASRDEPPRDAEVGEVAAIYVDPPYWNSGLGKALMEAGRRQLTTVGFGEATLWVLDSNARARAFYETDGWVPDGRRKTDESRGFAIQELRYRRSLP